MMDLVIAMTPYINEKNIGILYDMAVPWLQVGISFRCKLYCAILRKCENK